LRAASSAFSRRARTATSWSIRASRGLGGSKFRFGFRQSFLDRVSGRPADTLVQSGEQGLQAGDFIA